MGVPFNVRSIDEGFAQALRWHLGPFRRPRSEPQSVPVRVYQRSEDEAESPPPFTYLRSAEIVLRDPSMSTIATRAVMDIQEYACRNVRTFVAIHSGAVGTSEGALLMPGAPDTGKSTTTTALITAGFGYLSDEVAPIDPVTSRVYPYPRRVALDEIALDLFPGLADRLQDREGLRGHPFQRFIRPEDLGSKTSDPMPVRWLVFPSKDMAGAPRLTPVTRAEAVELLAANCFNLFRYEGRGVIMLSRVVAEAEAYQLSGGTALDRSRLLGDRFPPG